MSSKNYYYIKPKTEGKIVFRGSPAQSFDTPASETAPYATRQASSGQVLDMSFGPSAAPALHRPAISAISFGRLALLSLFIVVLYLGGFAVYAEASNLRGEISSLATRGVEKLEAAAGFLGTKDFQKATDNFTAAENLFTQAQQELLNLGQSNLYLSDISGNDFQIITGTKLVDAGLNLAQGGRELVVAMTPTFQYFNALGTQPVTATDVPGQIVNLLSASSQQLDRAVGKVSRANALLAEIDPNRIDPGYREAVVQAQLKTAALQEATSVLGILAQELPNALGFNNPRQYLLLNQNNNELRATGGFIGSFTIVTLYKGKIDEVFVDITQRVDGQNLRPSLSIPAPLVSISETGAFGTRDSNWYPDFPTSARTFQQLYEEAGGGTVDGIIAINPRLMQNLLNVTGPIELPIKEETITSSNFVDLTQQYTQVIDNQKENPKEILGELAPIMLDRLLALPSSELIKVNEILVSLLNSKDIMLYTRNPRLEKALNTLGFAGTLPAPSTSEDFLGVVRSNLGGRKSSSNLSSKITHHVGLNLGNTIESTLTLSYTHQGRDEFPDGPNKDYVRLYLPLGSTLEAMTGQDEGTQPETYEEAGKTVFAFWVTTAPGQTRDITLKYQPNITIDNQYSLRVFKQSGDTSWFKSTLRASAAIGIDGDMANKSKQLFDGQLTSDQILAAELIRAD